MNYVCLSKFSYLRTSYFFLESWKQVCNELYLCGYIRGWDFSLSSQSLCGLFVRPITCRVNAYSLIKVGCGFVFFFPTTFVRGSLSSKMILFLLKFPKHISGLNPELNQLRLESIFQDKETSHPTRLFWYLFSAK